GGEHQVVADLRLAEADLPQAGIAHVLHAMAAQAIVDEGVRAGLQAHQVADVVRRAVEPVASLRGEHRKRKSERSEEEPSHDVTRSGTGFTLSRTVYQGMRKKKRK